jgi:hypothetical protein
MKLIRRRKKQQATPFERATGYVKLGVKGLAAQRLARKAFRRYKFTRRVAPLAGLAALGAIIAKKLRGKDTPSASYPAASGPSAGTAATAAATAATGTPPAGNGAAASGSDVPEALDEAGMTRVRDQFVAAARRADAAGVDVLQLQLAHGGLLASFLSPLTSEDAVERRKAPLTNGDAVERRKAPLTNDDDLARRMAFPLTVVEALRAAWPEDKPLAAAIPAADWAPRGWTLDEAVVLTRALVQRGVDLVEPLSGQSSPAACPPYGRGFLVPPADRLRNEAGCATLVDGHLTRTSEINTILAAGRADLCVLDLEAERLSASADAAPTPGALLEVPA